MHSLLPTTAERPKRCSLLEFIEKVQCPPPANVNQTGPLLGLNATDSTTSLLDASLDSFELRKHEAWMDWLHEFAVLTITYEDQVYLIHINRSWAAPAGWRQYIPFPTWGSQKPSDDEVTIYRPGKEEEAARLGTYLVASFSLSDTVLLLAVGSLGGLVLRNPTYSLFGVNCWAFSRCLAWITLYEAGPSAEKCTIPSRPESASTDKLLAFLSVGNPWGFIPNANLTGRPGGLYARLLRKVDLILEVALRGSGFYRRVRGSPSVVELIYSSRQGTVYRRYKTVSVSSSGVTFDDNTGAFHEIPHSFGPTGMASDLPAIPHTSPSSPVGDFLYLLTPPIVLLEESTIPHFVIFVTTSQPVQENGIDGDRESDFWLEYGIVRQDNTAEDPRIVCRRKLTANRGSGCFTFVGLLEEFRPNDMMGVWVRGIPAEGASRPWNMVITSAYVGFGMKKVSCPTLPKGPPQNLPASSTPVAAPSLWRVWPFDGLQNKPEFGRPKPARDDPLLPAADEGSRVSAIPSSLNPCEAATNSNNPTHPTDPEDFLYLLTPQIQLAPRHKVLSVVVYAWSIRDSRNESSSDLFQVGTIRSIPAGELQESGPRHEIPRGPDPDRVMKSWSLKRYMHRMSHDHAFVVDLRDGDMIGIWVRVKDTSSAHGVLRAFIDVETGSAGGLVQRCVHSACDQIRRVVGYMAAKCYSLVTMVIPSSGAIQLSG